MFIDLNLKIGHLLSIILLWLSYTFNDWKCNWNFYWVRILNYSESKSIKALNLMTSGTLSKLFSIFLILYVIGCLLKLSLF